MANVHFLNEHASVGDFYLVRAVDASTDASTVVFRTEDRDQAAKLCGWLNGAVAER